MNTIQCKTCGKWFSQRGPRYKNCYPCYQAKLGNPVVGYTLAVPTEFESVTEAAEYIIAVNARAKEKYPDRVDIGTSLAAVTMAEFLLPEARVKQLRFDAQGVTF